MTSPRRNDARRSRRPAAGLTAQQGWRLDRAQRQRRRTLPARRLRAPLGPLVSRATPRRDVDLPLPRERLVAILHSRRARATFYVTVTSRAAPHRTRRAEVTRIDPKLVRAELGVGELRPVIGLPPRPVTECSSGQCRRHNTSTRLRTAYARLRMWVLTSTSCARL